MDSDDKYGDDWQNAGQEMTNVFTWIEDSREESFQVESIFHSV